MAKHQDSPTRDDQKETPEESTGGDSSASRVAELEAALLEYQEELTLKNEQVESLSFQVSELEGTLERLEATGSGNGEAPGETQEYVERVAIQAFGYRRRDPANPEKVLESRPAKPGEVVLLLPDQVERFEGLGFVGTQNDFEAAQEAKRLLTIEEIAMLSYRDVTAYLSQHSDNLEEIDKIEQAERSRALPTGTPADADRDDLQRAEILDKIETTRALTQEALEGARAV